MKTFQMNEKVLVICDSKKTSYGFKHTATLFVNGREEEEAKRCYYNRTWERFEYQSVIEDLIEKTTALSTAEKKLCANYIKNYNEQNPFKALVMVAKMGELLGTDQKEKNDWKARMLKAGLENKGLIMPTDWDKLSENEKERRLNGSIAILGNS